MLFVTRVALLFAFLAVASAVSHRSRLGFLGRKNPGTANLLKTKSSTSTCFYNLFLTNYDDLGFGGAYVSVKADGVYIAGLESVTLPMAVSETGYVVPVTAGQTLTVSYEKGSTSGNSLYITDINGNKVLSHSNPSSSVWTLTVASCSACVYSTQCSEVRVRNEWRSLSYCDQQLYQRAIQAFRSVKDTDGSIMYDNYVTLHNTISHTVASRELFLPWHRGMILHYENHLRAMGGDYSCVSLPYWDWTLDFGKEKASSLYADFGGMTEKTCLTGSFSWWYNPSLHECVIRRRFYDGNVFSPAFASGSAMELGIAVNSSYYFIFTYTVRNPHKSVHIFVGGSNGTMGTLSSPADPLFWMHHTMIDRIYALWQDCWDFDTPSTDLLQYTDLSRGSQGIDEKMPYFYPGFNQTVRAMLDMPSLKYRYPSSRRTLHRLNGANSITTPNACKWDWFNPSHELGVSKTNGFESARLPVHNTEQRSRLAVRNIAYKETLAATGDYYQAAVGQLAAECEVAAGDYDDFYPARFNQAADGTPIIGPSEMFKNACALLDDGNLELLFSH